MLEDVEREMLVELLLDAVAQHGRALLLDNMPRALRPNLQQEDDNRILLKRAIEICEEDRRRVDPPVIVTFIIGMRNYTPGSEHRLDQLARRLSVPPPAPSDPYMDLVIRSDIPFIDRNPLRSEVRRLLDPQTPRPILLVNGQRYSGKSFTSRFIDHLARSKALARYCPVEIYPGDTPTMEGIARSMLTTLGGAPAVVVDPMTNSKRGPRDLADDVWRQLTQKNEPCVIIIDGLNPRSANSPSPPQVNAEIADFVLRLGSLVRVNAHIHGHRLLLIDYNASDIAILSQDLRDIGLEEVTATEARTELERLFRGRGRGQDAAQLVDAVMDGLADPLVDLRALGTKCGQMLASL
ncbi:MAG TPA: hypothetical protein VIT38_12755 [Allosphingosinicella sp.]